MSAPRPWRLTIADLGVALALWVGTLFVPLFHVSVPRQGAFYIGDFYRFVPLLLAEPRRLLSGASVILGLMVTNIIPALIHILVCLCLARLATKFIAGR